MKLIKQNNEYYLISEIKHDATDLETTFEYKGELFNLMAATTKEGMIVLDRWLVIEDKLVREFPNETEWNVEMALSFNPVNHIANFNITMVDLGIDKPNKLN